MLCTWTDIPRYCALQVIDIPRCCALQEFPDAWETLRNVFLFCEFGSLRLNRIKKRPSLVSIPQALSISLDKPQRDIQTPHPHTPTPLTPHPKPSNSQSPTPNAQRRKERPRSSPPHSAKNSLPTTPANSPVSTLPVSSLAFGRQGLAYQSPKP